MRLQTAYPSGPALRNRQHGFTTLLVSILMLLILSVIVGFAAKVGVFEYRTSTNENRARLTQGAAESAMGLATQFVKSNSGNVISTKAGTGWLDPAASRWQSCQVAVASGQPDPCLAESDTVRRARMFRYFSGGRTTIDYTAMVPAQAQVTGVGGVIDASTRQGEFAVSTNVSALLCRLDTANPSRPCICKPDPDPTKPCAADPVDSRSYAVTLVSTADMGGESASAEVKQTLASYRAIGGASPVPLVASGLVEGLGNAQIVTSANAGGWGVPASIWSPRDVDIEASSGGGIGSVSTCHMGEYLQDTPRADLLTTCPNSNNACGCPADDIISGHSARIKREGIDILDIDNGKGALPDITYYPKEPYDDPNDPMDDSLFEWMFNKDVVNEGQTKVRQDCGTSANQDCAMAALERMATLILNDCNSLNEKSTGLIWVKGDCDLPDVVGTPEEPVVLVVENAVRLSGNAVFFGMMFIRSSDGTATMDGAGNVKVFGSIVVEGNVNLRGGLDIVYAQEITDAINNSPAFNRLGRLPGSWLDSRTAF
ncbi:hypothetical protein [Tahibacter amnicola]|uniref:PilX-like prepilin protein n=1 Tax=Tahibacter amnicola TaxID=2976241 RepID=A0ABY6BI46_9GAMM|nr:hypothetical protein [Tahibacter amnicola]UXI69683.1 hypothetical protein N4264_08645 [Tahibacter amnicola]